MKNRLNQILYPKQYFWNAAGSHEIDLLLDQGGRLYPIEIKSGRTIGPHFFDGLQYFPPLSEALPEESYLVYGGDEVQKRSVAQVLSWRNLQDIPM